MRSFAAAGLIWGALPVSLAGQDGYPASVPGAPPAVYADPRAAADTLERLLVHDSLDYGANWRAALALVTVAKRVPETVKDPVRDSLYRVAVGYAGRALRVAPNRPEGHFVLGTALGRAALTKSKREKIRDATVIRAEALRTIELDSLHDGAWHLLGRWHAEIMRLSGIQRFIAKRLLGAGVFGQASWAEAMRSLERAVALRPDWIYHRLDLALVYVDQERYADARVQLEIIRTLAPRDPMDPEYQRAALELLGRIPDKN